METSPEVKQDPVVKFGVIGVVVILAAVGYSVYRGQQRPAEALPSPTPTPVASTFASSTPALAETPTLEPTPTPTPTLKPSPTPRARRPGPAVATPAPVAEPTPTPTPAPGPPTVTFGPMSRPTPPPRSQVVAAVPAVSGTVYERSSADVAPPTLMTPMAHAPVPTALNPAEAVSVLEIVVNGDGTVESAKAATPPATLAETLEVMNWLSITKTWRFGPAVRNGQPVRYRLLIPLRTLMLGRAIR